MSHALNPDRLLGHEPQLLATARDLYESVKDLPIVSPHGHVPVEWLASDYHFNNPTELFITPDHYVTRLMHAHGVELADLGVNRRDFTDEQARHAFELFGTYWWAYAGTPMRYWFEDSLERVFGIKEQFGPETAGHIYDDINDMLKAPEFSTRELVRRFNIESIATTDDPVDDLKLHDQVIADPDFPATLAPAFRPDQYLEPSVDGWRDKVIALGEAAGVDASCYDGFFEAMRRRRRFFKEHGAVLSDHSHISTDSTRLDDGEAARLFSRAFQGGINAEDAARLRAHLFNDQAQLAHEDGLIMTAHPSVYRSYDQHGLEHYGRDIGGDIPARAEFSRALKPILNEFGNDPDFRLVAFTMDETVFSRSLAPLAGYYPALYVGAPWWFLDQPEAISRYFASVVPNCGFGKLSGFIDDTRALCSIPSRHDMNRRVTARYVAGLVADHRLSLDEGCDVMKRMIQTQPREVFRLYPKH